MADRVLPPAEGCRLLKADGSAWTVTGLRRRVDGGVEVDARRELEPLEDDVLPFRRPVRLESRRLAFGDRLVWEREDGSLLWTTRNPVDGTLAWGIDPQPGGGDGDRDDPPGGDSFDGDPVGAV